MVQTSDAQYFGKNKIQYEKFNWRFIQSKHFDVYFYDGGYDIARFTAEIAESAYVKVKSDFAYELSDRVIIIIYNSHNHFQQTNVTYSYLEEGIGGFTELFKNRVVVPYEGSYEQFRHVIHHELVHAVMNDMLYGGSIQSLVSGSVTQVPLWFAEGLAEYCSQRWNTQLDMVVRDATLTGYLPPIEWLDYFPYQGGASVFRYIAQKYGTQKIGEIMHKVKGSFSFESAFRSALGIDFKELTEEWQREMKRYFTFLKLQQLLLCVRLMPNKCTKHWFLHLPAPRISALKSILAVRLTNLSPGEAFIPLYYQCFSPVLFPIRYFTFILNSVFRIPYSHRSNFA